MVTLGVTKAKKNQNCFFFKSDYVSIPNFFQNSIFFLNSKFFPRGTPGTSASFYYFRISGSATIALIALDWKNVQTKSAHVQVKQ